MRVIIIQDKDARELLDQLELKRVKESGNVVKKHGDPIDDVHGMFQYVVVQWLQDQGANFLR